MTRRECLFLLTGAAAGSSYDRLDGGAPQGAVPRAPTELWRPPYSQAPEGVLLAAQVVDALRDEPVPGADVFADGVRVDTSDAQGVFRLRADQGPTGSLRLARKGYWERHLPVSLLHHETRLSLIPRWFKQAAFNQMCRTGSHGGLTRWVVAPGLVVQTCMLEYRPGSRNKVYRARGPEISLEDVEEICDDLCFALREWSDHTFLDFKHVWIDTAPPGSLVRMLRQDCITVARCVDLPRPGLATCSASGCTVTSGLIFLDFDADSSVARQSGARRQRPRWAVRAHEMGHAMGLAHVSLEASMMNDGGAGDFTPFDREAAKVAYQRRPGNRAPDIDAD